MTGMPLKTTGTQSIQRVVALLREIASYSVTGMRLVDLEAKLKLERSTVHRMLKCLVDEGMVYRDPTTRRYFLGPLVFELGLTAAPRFKFRELCQPSLARLAAKTGDSAYLTIRSGLDAVSIDRSEGSFSIQIRYVQIGERRPLGIGAGSIALLMALPDEEIVMIADKNANRLRIFGNLTVQTLLDAVRESQRLGYAFHDDRIIPSVSGVGLAIRDPFGYVVGAMSVSSLSSRLLKGRQDELVNLLSAEVKLIEDRLFADAPR
jgi:DNA-binding IclR family transcriptional regulator